jgi:hypothetical protein
MDQAAMTDADQPRETFAHRASGTVGVEEEVMLLDGATLDLRPDGPAVLASGVSHHLHAPADARRGAQARGAMRRMADDVVG